MMSNVETTVHRVLLERLILMALQRFERRSGHVVERVEITGGDVVSHALQEQHVLTGVKVVLRT